MNPPVIAIAMPIVDWVHGSTARSIFQLRGPRPLHVLDVTDVPVEIARNQLVEQAVARVPEYTHILWVDDDMAFPSDALERLLARGLPIVGGLCHNRRPPYMPTLFKYADKADPLAGHLAVYDWDGIADDSGLVEVDGTGTAFLLVRREVFATIAKTGEKPFTPCGFGEDLSFCYRAKKAGYKIFVDTSVDVGHMATVEVNDAFARRNRDFYAAAWIDRAKRAVRADELESTELPDPPGGRTRLRGDEPSSEARLARARYRWAGQEIAKRIRVGCVLDFGCGTGYGCPILAREALIRGSNVDILGYDSNPYAIVYGRTRWWPRLVHDWTAGARFDAITALHVIHDLVTPMQALAGLFTHAPIVIGSVPFKDALDDADFARLPDDCEVSVRVQGEGGEIALPAALPNTPAAMLFIIARKQRKA